MNTDLKHALLEVVTKGLPPEDAALLLLEPTRWKKDLFGPTGDLESIYQSYLRGEVGIGRVFDAASDIASAADSMAEIADSVSRNYGHDAKPDDVPEEVDEEDRVPAEDTAVEVLQVTGRKVSSTIIDSIRRRFPASLLEQVFPAPSGAPTDVPRLMQSFEGGFVVDRASDSMGRIVTQFFPWLEDAWSEREWERAAAIYRKLQYDASSVAGDLMVMNQVASAVVNSGMGDRRVPTQRHAETLPPIGERLEPGWTPTALDPSFQSYFNQLRTLLTKVNQGELTYRGLKGITDRAVREDSPIMSFVDVEAEKDIATLERGEEPVVEPEPELAAPPEAEPELAEPVEPTPAEPALAGILEPEEAEPAESAKQVFSDVLGIDDARASRLADHLDKRGISSSDLAGKLETVLDALVRLRFFRSWRGLQRTDPRRARLVRGSLRANVRGALETGRDVEAAELLRSAMQGIRGKAAPAAGRVQASPRMPAAARSAGYTQPMAT